MPIKKVSPIMDCANPRCQHTFNALTDQVCKEGNRFYCNEECRRETKSGTQQVAGGGHPPRFQMD